MKITLLQAFPDDYRQSMTYYNNQLAASLESEMGENDSLRNFLPDALFLKPNFMRYFSQYVLYPKAVSAIESDVYHITDHSYSHLVGALSGKKSVITFHDAIWLKKASALRRSTVLEWNLSGLQKANWIVCDSLASERALIEHAKISHSRHSVISPGLDPLFVHIPEGNPFQILGIKPEIYLLHVGHTGDYKNIPALFYVLAQIRRQGVEAKLLKAGTPFTGAQLATAKRLGIHHEVIHLGLVERKKIPYLYKASQILLFPSLEEGFGLPILEAMAADIPVISSNQGSLPELNPRQELQFDPKDYAGMAQAALRLLNDASYRKSVLDAGRKKLQEFSWLNTAQKFLEIYRRLT